MTSLRRDLTCAGILLVVALLYYYAASRIGATALADAVGAGGLPRVYGVALACIAVAIGLGTLLANRLRQSGIDGQAPRTLRILTRAAVTVAIGIAYLALAPLIGYPFAMAALIAAMAFYQGERGLWRVLLVAACGAAGLYLLFDIVLGITLPAPWNG